ncbi:glycosyltransferase [Aquabacter sp. CN5-332]|uniref:glycosyltransferase family 2 protein n=1 Tax=Aquabacter sp. CN5-332 TaxID=3156608 RepID=UPI0032B541E4
MKLVVIIPTLGRRDVADRLLAHLENQHRPPDEVIVSAPDESHAGSYVPSRYRRRDVFGANGLCAQRNRAMAAAGGFDILTFFDDDFLPADDYLASVVEAFEQNPGFAVLMGDVLRDGAHDAGLSFEEGCAILAAAASSPPRRHPPVDEPGAYGCNMSIRAALIGDLRFDERLPLYGWQEDIDFTSQLRRRGRVVRIATLIGVHLGLKGGRVSGVRFGYSQIINPIYLVRKGTMPALFAADLICRNVVSNVVRSIRPEPYVDRRGRLKGNLLGARHLMGGRIEPEYILQL